ncbi:hypothetical protein RRG08_016134 [Elysia crispata]|uniref:Uncharacterized protein n=1 Tax=Elysia crispata TaxID=231223 RepID=A0AAE1D910_9GAST|nr:hypothetical protein RRG08_016134 [Elysia crispata]
MCEVRANQQPKSREWNRFFPFLPLVRHCVAIWFKYYPVQTMGYVYSSYFYSSSPPTVEPGLFVLGDPSATGEKNQPESLVYSWNVSNMLGSVAEPFTILLPSGARLAAVRLKGIDPGHIARGL